MSLNDKIKEIDSMSEDQIKKIAGRKLIYDEGEFEINKPEKNEEYNK